MKLYEMKKDRPACPQTLYNSELQFNIRNKLGSNFTFSKKSGPRYA